MTSKKSVYKEFTKEHAEAMKIKNPDRIPVIVKTCDGINLKKNKYLVPLDLTIGQFQYVLRKNTNLNSSEAFFLFINSKLIQSSMMMQNVYELYNKDGFVHIHLAKENVFG